MISLKYQKQRFYLFADDTNIYYEAPNWRDLEATINNKLKKLDNWLCVNRLAPTMLYFTLSTSQ